MEAPDVLGHAPRRILAVARRWLARATIALSAALVAWVFGLILYGVASRYLVGASPSGSTSSPASRSSARR